MDEKIYIINALTLIDYEIVDEDLDFFVNYCLEKHYNIYVPLYNEWRVRHPKYFKILYLKIQPFL
jgi:hypothetical protein